MTTPRRQSEVDLLVDEVQLRAPHAVSVAAVRRAVHDACTDMLAERLARWRGDGWRTEVARRALLKLRA